MVGAPAVIAVQSGRILLPTLFGTGLGLSLNGSLPAIPDSVKTIIGIPTLAASNVDNSGLIMSQIAELRNAISARSSNVTVMAGDRQGGALSLTSVGFCVVAAGSGYAVFRYYGYGFKDVWWVSKTAFEKSVEHLSKGLDFLEGRLEAVKSELSNAIYGVSERQEQVIENQESLRASLEGVGDDVANVREQMNGMQSTMFSIASNVDSVRAKQDEATEKIDKWGNGIKLLCDVVGDSVADNPQLKQQGIALKRFASETGLIEYQSESLPPRSRPRSLPSPITSPRPLLECATPPSEGLPNCRDENRTWRSIKSQEA